MVSLPACLRVGRIPSGELASALAFHAGRNLLFSGLPVATSLARPYSPTGEVLCLPLPFAIKLVSLNVGRNAGRTHLLAGKVRTCSSETPTTGGR